MAKAKRERRKQMDAENVTGWKGFDPELKCRGFQYEIGKEYETETADLCTSGFHFCLNPLDVFGYYPPANGSLNRFAEVEASGVSAQESNDSKKASTHLKIKAEIGLPGLIKAGVEFILSRIKKDDNPAATNTGDRSAATNTGDQSAATNTGYRSAAKVEGKESVAMAVGIEGRASGALGCWLVLSEWEEADGEWHRKDVRCTKVDGEIIKPGVLYMLKDGEFVEVEGGK